jgi:23S rRNA (uridine2552-2'-O)-methyltransferase
MEEIPGVEFIHGDFTEQPVLHLLEERLGGQAADLVISDMAPNISGISDSDQARSIYLAELALDFADKHLKPGGGFLVKTFQGEGFSQLFRAMQGRFDKVASRKPKASRAESREIYLYGKGFKGGG